MTFQELTLEYQVPGALDGETINAPFVPGSDVDDPDQVRVFTPGALGILDLTGEANAVGGQYGNRYPIWFFLTNYTANQGDVLATVARRADPTDPSSPLVDELPYLVQPAPTTTNIYSRRILSVPQGFFLRVRTLSRADPNFPTVLRLGVFAPVTQTQEVLIRRAICCTFDIPDQQFPFPDESCDPPLIQGFDPSGQVLSGPNEAFAIQINGGNLQADDLVEIIRDGDNLTLQALSTAFEPGTLTAEFNSNQFFDDPTGDYTIRVTRADDSTCFGEATGYSISIGVIECLSFTPPTPFFTPGAVNVPFSLNLSGNTDPGDVLEAVTALNGTPVPIFNVSFQPTSVTGTVSLVPPASENAIVFRYLRAGCPDAEVFAPIQGGV